MVNNSTNNQKTKQLPHTSKHCTEKRLLHKMFENLVLTSNIYKHFVGLTVNVIPTLTFEN